MMQCYMRQHFADRYWLHEHPGGRASWREPTMRKFTKESTTYFVTGLVCRWNVQKMRSESSEYERKTQGFLHKQLENENSLGELLWRACTRSLGQKLDEPWHADCVVEHMPSWIDCDDSEGASWTTQREWSVECSWGNCKPNTRNFPWVRSSLERRREILGWCQRWISARRSWLRDGKRLIGYIPRVCVRLFQCKNARMQAWNRWPWFGWTQTSPWIQHTRRFVRSCVQEYKTKKQGKIQRALPASQLFSAMPPLEAVKVLVSIMMSVGLSNKGKPMKLTHYDISRAHFQGTAQRLIYIRLPAEDRQKYGEDKVGRLVKSMYGTQDAAHIWQLDYVNLICGEVGGFRRGKQSAASPTIPIKMWEWKFTATTVCVCRTMMDSNTSTALSNPNIQRKTCEHLNPKIQTWKAFCCWTVCLELGHQSGQYLDIEPWLDTRTTHHQWTRMQYEHQYFEHTTRETTRQTGI